MKLEQAYYLHAALNYHLFNGKLEAVIIKTFDFDDDRNENMIEAQTITELDPFLIYVSNQALEGDPVYFTTVLLHEMIHQYNRQEDIEDTDPYTGKHLHAFFVAADKHGLINGYALKPETEQLIKKLLESYAVVYKCNAMSF